MFGLRQDKLSGFFEAICAGRAVFALAEDAGQYHLVSAPGWDPGTHALGSYRPVEPLKGLLLPVRESVDVQDAVAGTAAMPERVVIGVKHCDLSSLRIHDYVFRDSEPQDPFYTEAREKTVIVSADCTDALDVCFCTAVGQQPYSTAGFDVNLSPTDDGFVVESGSDKGEELLRLAQDFLDPADDNLVAARNARRDVMTERVRAQAEARGLPDGADLRAAIEGSVDSEVWDAFAEDCVECGACNFACCTCHCFLLADGRKRDGASGRVRKWDSCLYRNFARVAGGGNPRKHRAERLYNRFDKKFSFFPQVLGEYACDGCGRCAEACTGKIDIRDVLKRALDGQ